MRAELLERVADRVSAWRDDARFGVAVLVLVAVVAGVVWYRVGVSGGATPTASATPTTIASTSAAPAPAAPTRGTTATPSPTAGAASARSGRRTPVSTTLAPMIVHVAGSVSRPGVVALSAGARVADALKAAGGANADADLDRLNLAALVTDGERVFVAKVGQADPAAGLVGGNARGAGAAVPSGPLNLNTATATQLEALPGIGPTLAQAILAERQRRGRFTSVNELRTVRGIGDARFADLQDLVTV